MISQWWMIENLSLSLRWTSPQFSILCESDKLFQLLPIGPLCSISNLPRSPQGQKVVDDHSQPCSGSTGSSQILQKPSSHHKELQLAPQFDQNPHLPPPSLPRPVQAPLPSCMPIKELIHTLQHSPSLREQHDDLLHLSATLRLHSIRLSSKKNAWFFTFPQTTAQSSATRPGPLSCVLKTTLRPPHSTSTCSSVPNMSCLNDQPT